MPLNIKEMTYEELIKEKEKVEKLNPITESLWDLKTMQHIKSRLQHRFNLLNVIIEGFELPEKEFISTILDTFADNHSSELTLSWIRDNCTLDGGCGEENCEICIEWA